MGWIFYKKKVSVEFEIIGIEAHAINPSERRLAIFSFIEGKYCIIPQIEFSEQDSLHRH